MRQNSGLRLQRGVGMCGIGKTMAVAECQTVAGATDATITTEVGSLSSVWFMDTTCMLIHLKMHHLTFRRLVTTCTATAPALLRTLATNRQSAPAVPRAADFAQVEDCCSDCCQSR